MEHGPSKGSNASLEDAPSGRVSKCKCAPVLHPLDPISPSTSPAAHRRPGAHTYAPVAKMRVHNAVAPVVDHDVVSESKTKSQPAARVHGRVAGGAAVVVTVLRAHHDAVRGGDDLVTRIDSRRCRRSARSPSRGVRRTCSGRTPSLVGPPPPRCDRNRTSSRCTHRTRAGAVAPARPRRRPLPR